MQQLLSNLLGNAIAHGAPDQLILVDVALTDDRLMIAVTNSGLPIAAEHLPKVFEPYWRPTGASASGGLGLGLFICSEIARAHKGTIEVVSSAATGTKFTVWLPMRNEAPQNLGLGGLDA